MHTPLELKFIEYKPDAYVSACLNIAQQGDKHILLRPFNRFAADFLSKIAQHNVHVLFYVKKDECELSLPENAKLLDNDSDKIDAVFLFTSKPRDLSALLMDYLGLRQGLIVAPITQHYYRSKPLFLISIPKSGTHLLYRLAEILGYKPGVILNDRFVEVLLEIGSIPSHGLRRSLFIEIHWIFLSQKPTIITKKVRLSFTGI